MTKTNKIRAALWTAALVVGVGVGYTAAAQTKTATRAEYKAACLAQAPESVDERTKNAVCECAVQYISAMKSEDSNRFNDFNIAVDDPLVGQAVPICLDIAGQLGPNFYEVFEQIEAGASASE